MADNELSPIWRIVEIKAREIGSRRITAEQFRTFLDELKRVVPNFTRFHVLRFGHNDRLLYPVEEVHEAINHYEVRRIQGEGHHPDVKYDKVIEIDLSNDIFAHGNYCFTLVGTKPLVDAVEGLIWEHIHRWQPTWHAWCHYEGVNFALTFFLGVGLFVRFLFFLSWPDAGAVVQLAALAYLFGFMLLVTIGAKTIAPFFWFYRPGSPIEGRRQWLPRLSIGAIFATGCSVAANILSSLLNQ